MRNFKCEGCISSCIMTLKIHHSYSTLIYSINDKWKLIYVLISEEYDYNKLTSSL